MSPYPVGLKNPALVDTIDRGWQLKAEALDQPNEEAMLRHLYEKLKSLAGVGKELGVTGQTISKRCQRWGIKRGGPGGANNPWGRTGKRKKRNGLVVPQSAEDVRVRW